MALSRTYRHIRCMHPCNLVRKQSRLLHFSCVKMMSIDTSNSVDPCTDFKKQNIPPFVKDLFIGKFNKALLSYAEILDDERYLNLESKVEQLRSFLDKNANVIEQIDKTSKIHPDLVNSLKRSGMFGMSVPSQDDQDTMFFTEIGRFYEEFGDSLALADLLVTNESLGVRPLVLHADQSQRSQYLGKLRSGETRVAWCLGEASSGSDPTGVETRAHMVTGQAGDQCWSLSGTKTWVSGARDAQLLLVFAKTKSEDGADNMSCFIVDRTQVDPNTISISENKTLAGYRGLEVCDVKFDQCHVAANCVLGHVGEGLKIIQTVTNHNKYLQSFAIVKYLKNILNETVDHCNNREQFDKNLSEFSLVRSRLGRMTARLFALESAVYMTAGLADASLEGDIEVESVITRQYATETADYIISNCLKLLGANVNLESSKYQRYIRDSVVLQHWQGSSNINKCFVAISCLQHLIKHKPDLANLRQAADGHLMKSLRFQVNSLRHQLNRVVFTHNLHQNFAIGLQTSGRRLEWCVAKLPYVAEELLVQRGANLQVEEEYLGRLYDLASEVYILTCVLSRASRSLTLGLDSFELEATMAVNLSFEAKQRVKALCVETVLCNEEESNRDEITEHSADYITRRGRYVAVHPLTKNSF